jgi:ubiquinone/menaquinone biosynthesis C-methylase UbiE
MGKRFDPDRAERLLSPERRALLPPEALLGLLAIGPHDNVADIGVGPGYFAIPAAALTDGTVYGVDIEDRMLAYARERAKEAGCGNFRALLGDALAIPLDDGSVDAALCAFVLHEVDDLQAALRELRRVVRAKEGRLLITEWEKIDTPAGPPVAHRLARQDLRAALREAGVPASEEISLNETQYAFLCRF